MAGESTPLIQTVRVGPPQRRYQQHTCRRFCNIAFTCLLICGIASFALNLFSPLPHHRHHHHHGHHSLSRHNGKSLRHEDLQTILLDTPSAEKAEEWNRYYTSGAHLAGKNYSQVISSPSGGIHDANRQLTSLRPPGRGRDGKNGASSPASLPTMFTSITPSTIASHF